MRILYDKPWEYAVLRESNTDRLFIEVLCGSSGLYEVRVPLTRSEVRRFRRDPRGLNALANAIRRDPERYIEIAQRRTRRHSRKSRQDPSLGARLKHAIRKGAGAGRARRRRG